jgi:hypothetical protein
MILIFLLLLIVLAALFQQPSMGKEDFYVYTPEAGKGVWGTSPQCDDTAINLQEDTSNPGRYWGWLNNSQESCAFYNFGSGGGGPVAAAQSPPAPLATPTLIPSAGQQEVFPIVYGSQCGGNSGACDNNNIACVDSPWPWPQRCAPESTCVRQDAGMWTCKRN